MVRYWVMRLPYTPDDAVYMTSVVLRNKFQMPPSVWKSLTDERRAEYVSWELWDPANVKKCACSFLRPTW